MRKIEQYFPSRGKAPKYQILYKKDQDKHLPFKIHPNQISRWDAKDISFIAHTEIQILNKVY